MRKGIFITFEGSEGSGKSTQSELLAKYLKNKGYPVIHLREPGSTGVAEKIRRILLDSSNKAMTAECEMLLYMAARADIVARIIKPALAKGKVIVCDRFLDSTLAYQGYGLGVGLQLIKAIGKFTTQGIKPNLTFYLDLPLKQGLKRCGTELDRIEKRSLKYHQRVRNGYLKLARLEPKRIKVIKADKTIPATQDKIRKLAKKICRLKI